MQLYVTQQTIEPFIINSNPTFSHNLIDIQGNCFPKFFKQTQSSMTLESSTFVYEGGPNNAESAKMILA